MFDLRELETSTFENGNTVWLWIRMGGVNFLIFLLFTQLNLAETSVFAFF